MICSLINNNMNNIETLKSLCVESKYLRWYLSIVSKKYSVDEYTEKHHILPKSLGGNNSRSNIVRISGKAHFICHMLLARMMNNSKNKKNMIHALNMLAKANNENQNRYEISSRSYELIRKQLSDSMKGENNPMFGKPAPNRDVTHTSETRKKISDASISWNEANPGARKGRVVSDATRERQKGPKTAEARANMSVSAKNKPRIVCIHCGISFTTSNHTRYHGDKCKMGLLAPSLNDIVS